MWAAPTPHTYVYTPELSRGPAGASIAAQKIATAHRPRNRSREQCLRETRKTPQSHLHRRNPLHHCLPRWLHFPAVTITGVCEFLTLTAAKTTGTLHEMPEASAVRGSPRHTSLSTVTNMLLRGTWSSGDILGTSPGTISGQVGGYGLFGRYDRCGLQEASWIHPQVS